MVDRLRGCVELVLAGLGIEIDQRAILYLRADFGGEIGAQQVGSGTDPQATAFPAFDCGWHEERLTEIIEAFGGGFQLGG